MLNKIKNIIKMAKAKSAAKNGLVDQVVEEAQPVQEVAEQEIAATVTLNEPAAEVAQVGHSSRAYRQ